MPDFKAPIFHKVLSLSTDGEAANTGSNAGLWRKLTDELGRFILCIWCVCHRSDLAFHDLTESVPEMKRWYSQVKSTVSYFTVSSCRRKSVKIECTRADIVFLEFKNPPDVRFAEHIHAMCAALLNNLPACNTHWKSIIDGPDDKKVKAQASGYLKQWEKDGEQLRLTALMADILHHFACMQKEFQKTDLLIFDVRDIQARYLARISEMLEKPYPGEWEEKRTFNNTVNVPSINSLQGFLLPVPDDEVEQESGQSTAPKRRRKYCI